MALNLPARADGGRDHDGRGKMSGERRAASLTRDGREPEAHVHLDLVGNGFLDVTTPHLPATLGHSLTRMTGRDPNESHRAATPLELLFDLAFVAAFGAGRRPVGPSGRRRPSGQRDRRLRV